MARPWLLGWLFWFASALAASAQTQPPADRTEARRLFAEHRFEESAAAWMKVLAADHDDAEALEALGVAYDLLGRHRAATAYLEQAADRNPDAPGVWNNLAINLTSLGQNEKAATALERSLQLAPGSPNTLYNLGSIRFEQGRCDAAIPLFERARTKVDSDAALDFKLAVCYLRASRKNDAGRLWQKSAPLQSTEDVKLLTQLAEESMRSSDDALAADVYGRAAQLTHNPRLLYNTAKALFLDRKFEEALRICRSIPPEETEFAQYHRLVADLLFELGKSAESLPEYERAIDLAPDQADYYLRLAVVLLAGKAGPQAERVLEVAKHRFPSDSRMEVAFGFAQALQGSVAEAIKTYRNVIARDPHSFSARYFLARAYLDGGDAIRGIAVLEDAVRALPAVARAHFELGVALVQQTGTQAAETQFAEAVRLDPHHADAQYNLGKLLWQRGDAAAAEQHLRAAVSINPNLAPAHYVLFQLYSKLGRTSEAEAQRQAFSTLHSSEEEMARTVVTLTYDLN